MLAVRDRLNEAHVALAYLLVVLGASGYAGRAVGLGLALAAFVLFDWFFLPPYATLVVANPLDWLVLLAFFGTSVVAAQLLYHARAQAESAQARAAEIDRLAVLGAETLNAGRADDVLPAVADVMRTTLEVDWCAVYVRDADQGGVVLAARAPSDPTSGASAPVEEGSLVAWVAAHDGEAAVHEDGTSRVAARPDGVIDGRTGEPDANGPPVRALYLPLRVRDRVVGVLGLGAHAGLRLNRARQRVLRALSYYAALGVERVRLVREAEHAATLRHADRLKDALLASVSHDLRTPLTTIKALANAIAVSGDERATTIEEEADHLNRLVEGLLDLSRLQAGGRTSEPSPNEAEDLIGAALRRVTGRLAGREIRATVDGQPDAVLIGRFDFADTLRALVNVLENALKFSPADVPIDLMARRDGPWLAFIVADRGPGIPGGDADRIFQPFNRPSGSAPDVGGAGLGLSIARSLATAQGGSLEYQPRPGGGSVFTLRVRAQDVEESRTAG